MEELGMAGEDSGTGGRQTKGLGDVFKGVSAGGSFIRIRDVGDDPPHGTGHGDLLVQGFQVYNREAAEATEGLGAGSTHRWRQQWRRRVLRRWELMY